MDIEIIYSLIGIAVLVVVIIFTLKKSPTSNVQTKEGKKQQIINDYKKELREALEPLKNDREVLVRKKSELLKKFSNELALNIFFDKDELRVIISELSIEG